MHTAQINPSADLAQSVFGFAAPEPPRPLTQFQQRVLGWIRARAAKLKQGFCLATKTIAAKFGCSVSYVQKAVKVLIERGLIAREWDYTLKTRRRFRLPSQATGQSELSFTQGAPETHQETPTESVHSADYSAPTKAIPPISSGESDKKEDNGPPASSSSFEPEGSLISKASEVLGVPKAAAAKIVTEATAKASEPAHVDAALDAVQRAGAKARNPISYLFGTLANFVLQGGPRVPAPAPAPPVLHFHVAAPLSIDPRLVGVTTWKEACARLALINGSTEVNS